jgi:hypothetical protein
MGIASVWINQGSDTCNDPGVRAVLTELGVPEDHMVYGMAALGYAAAEPKDVEKKIPGDDHRIRKRGFPRGPLFLRAFSGRARLIAAMRRRWTRFQQISSR